MDKPSLIEPGTKYFLKETLKKVHIEKTEYDNNANLAINLSGNQWKNHQRFIFHSFSQSNIYILQQNASKRRA